jgi:hypothetical protein
MVKPMKWVEITPEESALNQISFTQIRDSIDTYNNKNYAFHVAGYHKSAILLKSGLIYEVVKYLLTLNPNYSVIKLPNEEWAQVLTQRMGNDYQYDAYYEQLTKNIEEGVIVSGREALDAVLTMMDMVNAIEKEKAAIIDTVLLVNPTNIFDLFCKDILHDMHAIKLPVFRKQFETFREYSLPLYAVSQYLTDGEYKDIRTLFSTLRTILFYTLLSTMETYENTYRLKDDYNTIDIKKDALPGISLNVIEIGKEYNGAFNYSSEDGLFEKVFERTISTLYYILNMLSGTPSGKNSSIIPFHAIDNTPCMCDIKVPYAMNILLSHHNETYQLVASLYKVINEIDTVLRDIEEVNGLPDIDYSTLTELVRELSMYLITNRLTISLLFAQYIGVKTDVNE